MCPIYANRIVKNVRVKPSPRWMRERLRAMGVRPINTSLISQTMSCSNTVSRCTAFDLRSVGGRKIRVRRANAGESIVTLDGVERKLEPHQLIIADCDHPIAIAGVMGGEYSGILDDTTTIVFESACFDGVSVRTTARDPGACARSRPAVLRRGWTRITACPRSSARASSSSCSMPAT